MYTGTPAISAMAMARCTASASASGGRVSAWYTGAVFPSASARAISTSITLPFSACMQMSAPFLRSARAL